MGLTHKHPTPHRRNRSNHLHRNKKYQAVGIVHADKKTIEANSAKIAVRRNPAHGIANADIKATTESSVPNAALKNPAHGIAPAAKKATGASSVKIAGNRWRGNK